MDFVRMTDHNSSGLPKVFLLLYLERIKPSRSFSFFSDLRKSPELLYINSFQEKQTCI